MTRMTPVAALIAATLLVTGCQSKQSKLEKLETKYNAMLTMYMHDCNDVIFDPPSSPRVPRCNAEQAKMKPVYAQITALTEQIAKQ